MAIGCLAGKGSHVICSYIVSSHVVDRHVLAGKSCVPCILKEENSCRSKKIESGSVTVREREREWRKKKR